MATITSRPEQLDEPVRFRDRDFAIGFQVRINGLAAPHDGVELAPLAGKLDALPDAATWSVRMRRTLLPLSDRDATLLLRRLEPKIHERRRVLADYMRACRADVTP